MKNIGIHLKKIIIAVILIIVICLICIFILFYPWITLWIHMSLLPNPPKPEITYGEFPFRLTYELNDEVKIVDDTLICKFDGFSVNEGSGKRRKWKTYLKSGNTRITLFKNEEIEIFFTPGLNDDTLAATYMGDTEFYQPNINSTFPNAYYTKNFDDKRENAYIISGIDMWHEYGVRLIKWEPSAPIQNIFK